MTTISPRLYNRNEPRAREVEALLLANRDAPRGAAYAYAADFADATCTRATAASYFDPARGRLIPFGVDEARVLYDGSIYVEGAATNLALRSGDFTHATWTASQCSVAAAAEIGPDGSACGGLVTFKGRDIDLLTQAISVTSGDTYATSIFAKRANLQGDASLAVGSLLFATGACRPTGKWRRFGFTKESPGTASVDLGLLYASGDAESRVLVDGFQVEECGFPTSPIETAGSTATRPADVVSIADGDWNTDICTDPWEFDIWPDFASDEQPASGASAWLFATNAGADSVRFYYNSLGAPFLILTQAGLDIATTSIAGFTFSRRQRLTIGVTPSSGTLSISGATSGNEAVVAGVSSAWTPGAALTVSRAANPFYGRVSRPRLITT